MQARALEYGILDMEHKESNALLRSVDNLGLFNALRMQILNAQAAEMQLKSFAAIDNDNHKLKNKLLLERRARDQLLEALVEMHKALADYKDVQNESSLVDSLDISRYPADQHPLTAQALTQLHHKHAKLILDSAKPYALRLISEMNTDDMATLTDVIKQTTTSLKPMDCPLDRIHQAQVLNDSLCKLNKNIQGEKSHPVIQAGKRFVQLAVYLAMVAAVFVALPLALLWLDHAETIHNGLNHLLGIHPEYNEPVRVKVAETLVKVTNETSAVLNRSKQNSEKWEALQSHSMFLKKTGQQKTQVVNTVSKMALTG